jgi:hypothetical protein
VDSVKMSLGVRECKGGSRKEWPQDHVMANAVCILHIV